MQKTNFSNQSKKPTQQINMYKMKQLFPTRAAQHKRLKLSPRKTFLSSGQEEANNLPQTLYCNHLQGRSQCFMLLFLRLENYTHT